MTVNHNSEITRTVGAETRGENRRGRKSIPARAGRQDPPPLSTARFPVLSRSWNLGASLNLELAGELLSCPDVLSEEPACYSMSFNLRSSNTKSLDDDGVWCLS